ncbi:hypothetical protein GGI17_006354 [Coemansia sp. S146]|nr:hypothetical protein GGI17_006354 [Coemansia sp. S146]
MSIAKRIVTASQKAGHTVRARITRRCLTDVTATATVTSAQPIDGPENAVVAESLTEAVQETALASSSSVEMVVAESTVVAESREKAACTANVLAMLEALRREVGEVKAWMGSREADIEEREAALKDRKAILEGRETEVEDIDRAVDRAESQQEALNIGTALAEARHNASLLVISRAKSCEEIAIADTSIGTETLVDIVRATADIKTHTRTLGNDIDIAIKRLEALFETIARAESCKETAFAEPAAGADAIRGIYDPIARTKSSREALDSGVVIAEEADAAVQRVIASVDEREMATDGEYEYEYEYEVAANDDERKMTSDDYEWEMAIDDYEPATARAKCHMGITMALEHARNISQDLHTHMEDGSSDDDDEVAATANVAKALDSAIALVDANLGPVAVLEVAAAHAQCHMGIIIALDRAANLILVPQGCKELDNDYGFVKVVEILDRTASLGSEYLLAVADGADISYVAEILKELQAAIARVELRLDGWSQLP